MRRIAAGVGKKPLLLPLPFVLWHVIAYAAERLPNPPVTTNQVELMRFDNVASLDAPRFSDLGMTPKALEALLPEILSARR